MRGITRRRDASSLAAIRVRFIPMNRTLEPAPGPRHLEFWFDFASPYSYLSVMRIDDLAQEARLAIRWRPFLLGPIFKSFGWSNSPFVLQKQKGDYMWNDMARQCRKYGLPWSRPSVFPRLSVLPVRIGLYGAEQPWVSEFCKRVMLLNFATDQDIAADTNIAAALDQLRLPAAQIIAAALSEANKTKLRAQTEQAMARAIFGAPTFFVNGEMFWGNDRLDDAIAYACEQAPA